MDSGYRSGSAWTEEQVLKFWVPFRTPLRPVDAVVHDPVGFQRLGERFGTG
jgi:hypothetical protein